MQRGMVEIRKLGSGQKWEAYTIDASGNYDMPSLPDGVYEVTPCMLDDDGNRTHYGPTDRMKCENGEFTYYV